MLVTRGTLETFQVQPVAGRWLGQADQEPGSAETVMLGFGYWQRRFGGARSAVGRGIIVDGRAREIVGIMPRAFVWWRPIRSLSCRLASIAAS